MLKRCLENRILRAFLDKTCRLLKRVVHAAFIRDYDGVFVSVYLLRDFADRVPGRKRSLRRRGMNDEFRPMNFQVHAFQTLACRHQPGLGKIDALWAHSGSLV
jgi:hypothetical protein